MKKIIFVFVVLALLCIPFVALADMSAPEYVVYKAYVSNPDGAVYYEYVYDYENPSGDRYVKDGVFEFGKELNVSKAYYKEDYVEVHYDDLRKYVKIQDITINDLSDYKLGEKENAKVFGKANIYDIPTELVSEEGHIIATIPDEADIIVQPLLSQDPIMFDDTYWYYVSYNGTNGWILLEDVAKKLNEDAMYYMDDYYTSRALYTNKGNIIPAFTKIDDTKYYNYPAYLYLQGVTYIGDEYVAMDESSDLAKKIDGESVDDFTYITLFDGVKLFEEPRYNSKVVVDSVASGTVLIPDYYVLNQHSGFEAWVRVTYNGIVGWMNTEYLIQYKNEEEANKTFEYNKKENEEWNLELPTNTEELAKKYIKNTNISINNSANNRNYNYEKMMEAKEGAIIEVNSGEANTALIIPTEKPIVAVQNASENLISNIRNVAIIICASVVVLITVVVIIVLVNKSRKK